MHSDLFTQQKSWILMLNMTYEELFLCQNTLVQGSYMFRKDFFEYGPVWHHKGWHSLYGHFSRKNMHTQINQSESKSMAVNVLHLVIR